jgi:hypothetical protein
VCLLRTKASIIYQIKTIRHSSGETLLLWKLPYKIGTCEHVNKGTMEIRKGKVPWCLQNNSSNKPQRTKSGAQEINENDDYKDSNMWEYK